MRETYPFRRGAQGCRVRCHAARLVFLLSTAGLELELAAQTPSSSPSVSAQAISLPSGPGSIEGLGESFEPQLNTGTYAMGLPLKLPPVRGAVQPEVRFAYNSGSGNGPLGLGWRLDVPALQRQTDKGLPQYTADHRFTLWLNGQAVVEVELPPVRSAAASPLLLGNADTGDRPRSHELRRSLRGRSHGGAAAPPYHNWVGRTCRSAVTFRRAQRDERGAGKGSVGGWWLVVPSYCSREG